MYLKVWVEKERLRNKIKTFFVKTYIYNNSPCYNENMPLIEERIDGFKTRVKDLYGNGLKIFYFMVLMQEEKR